jgi:hypothetical protein
MSERLRHGLKPTEPLLVGRLYIYQDRKGVGVEVWCPYCKATHAHGWLGLGERPARSNAVSHRCAHCHVKESPFKNRGYWIGLDPSHSTYNRRILRQFANLQIPAPGLAQAKPSPLGTSDRTAVAMDAS